MGSETVDKGKHGRDADSPGETEKRGINWEDPSIRVGDAPPLPRWPLVVLGVAWLGWIVFLSVMVVSRSDAAMM